MGNALEQQNWRLSEEGWWTMIPKTKTIIACIAEGADTWQISMLSLQLLNPELWAILDGYCVNAVSVLCLVPEVLPAAGLCERMVRGRWLSGLVRAQYSVKLLALCRPPATSKSSFYHHKLNARLMQLADLCCLLLWVGARLAFKHAHVCCWLWWMVMEHEAQVQGRCVKLVCGCN